MTLTGKEAKMTPPGLKVSSQLAVLTFAREGRKGALEEAGSPRLVGAAGMSPNQVTVKTPLSTLRRTHCINSLQRWEVLR
jgi:hypothetical protein